MNYLKKSSLSNLLRYRKNKKYDELPLLKSNRKYIDLGLISGGSFLSLVALITLFLTIQFFYYRNIKKNLEPFVLQHDNLLKAISYKNKELSKIKNLNNSLVDSIIRIRSSSSIMSEISKLIPKSIVLNEISVKKNYLELKGIVDHLDGLEVINLFN